jgi:hypothetical protein
MPEILTGVIVVANFLCVTDMYRVNRGLSMNDMGYLVQWKDTRCKRRGYVSALNGADVSG